jgi:hypothetical protein
MVDLVIGEPLSNQLSGYFQLSGELAIRIAREKRAVIDSEANKMRAEMHKTIVGLAREALGVKDAGESMLQQPAGTD